MKKIIPLCAIFGGALFYGLLGCNCLAGSPETGREVIDFNSNWRFIKADPSSSGLNPVAIDFDDSSWAVVSAPHTFNDTDTFDNWSVAGHRGECDQWSGRTWYRKSFVAPENWRGKKVFIEFEAVRQIGEVWLNGKKLGASKSGFSPFGFDITPHLRSDGVANTLAVMVDNRFMEDPIPAERPLPGRKRAVSLTDMLEKMEDDMPENIADLAANQIPWNNPHWHPAHGGIYRNVRIHVTDPLHITLPLYSFLETEGVYAYATEISSANARVGIDIPIRNDRATSENITVVAEVFESDNNNNSDNNKARPVFRVETQTSLASGASTKIKLSGSITNPHLWEPNYPHLYRVVCRLVSATGETIDTTTVPLGIRTVRWTADEGFFINGRHLKLRGWGQKPTDEWPGLGAAQPDWLHYYTLKLMRDAGGNFVRWGHAAGGPASINAGDRLGIIALQPGADGEKDTAGAAWKLRSSLFRDIIIYFRNNPSILIWEGGNQKVSREHAAELRGYMDKYDPHGGRAYAHRRADEITAEFMDIGVGTEGKREIARMPIVEGEYNREESPRRVWDEQSPPTFGYAAVPEKIQTYRLNSEQFAVNQVRHWVKKLGQKAHSGGANWIFSDSTSGGRVETEVARASGEVDGVRLPKEAYYVCQVMWSDDPRVHIIGHWTYPSSTKKNIYVVANNEADAVELFLNGKSLGHVQPTETYLFTFADVAFEPGTLQAVSYRAGRQLATHTLRTVGPAVALRMTPITSQNGLLADGSDVALIDVEAVDADGNRCPTWQNRVDFSLEGPAIWRGGYNSGKINSINNTWLDLECGINRVAIKSTLIPGKITLTAHAKNLKKATCVFVTQETKPAPEKQIWQFELRKPDWSALATPRPALVKSAVVPERMIGRFTKTFSYSGPGSTIVELANDAQPGRNAYADTKSPLPADLPDSLISADWIQTANADALYSALDFVEISVTAGATITVAHDDRLTRPGWLTSQFEATPQKLTILGQSMTLFSRKAKADESVTMGDNVELKTEAAVCPNMYLVFVNKGTRPQADNFRVETGDTTLELRRENGRIAYIRLGAGQSGWNWLKSSEVFEPNLSLVDEGRKVGIDWKLASVEAKQDASAKRLIATFTADSLGLLMRVTWTGRSGPGPVEQAIEVTNRSQQAVVLGGIPSLVMRVTPQPPAKLEHWWVEKGAGRPGNVGTHRESVHPDFHHRSTSSPRAIKKNSNEPIPWQCIHDTVGAHGIYTGIVSSAHTAQQTRMSGDGQMLEIVLGLDETVAPFYSQLKPGGSLTFPPVFIGCYEGSVDEGCQRLHRWVERWQLPQSSDERFPLLTNCSWGHQMQIDETICKRMIDDAAPLGFEMYHIDAGWYRDVGLWKEDPEKFPSGLRAISDYAHAKGLKFGLWVAWTQGGHVVHGQEALSVFEPTMRDWFPKDAPDNWRAPPWSGQACCLGCPDARNWCLNELRRIVREYNLDMLEHDQQMITWDCGRKDHDHTSSVVDAGRSAAEGYYEIYDTLRREFPDLLLENCVNGGCTVDYGIMQRCHYVSITDTYDPLSNRQAFYDASHALPPRALEAYVAKYPAPTLANFRYVLRSGMLGYCNIMIDTTKWTEAEQRTAKRQFEIYKTRLRPLIRQGNLYRIADRPSAKGWDAFQYNDPTTGDATILVFRAKSPEFSKTIKLRGLSPAATYEVKFEDCGDNTFSASGESLMTKGLPFELPEKETSEIVYLTRRR